MTHWKNHWCWERLRVGEEDIRRRDGWMASPMHWTWTWQILAGDGEGQGALVCCSPWGCKESDITGWLNNKKKYYLDFTEFLLKCKHQNIKVTKRSNRVIILVLGITNCFWIYVLKSNQVWFELLIMNFRSSCLDLVYLQCEN